MSFIRLIFLNKLSPSYEERALYLEAIILNHKENMMFEDFAAQVFSPSPTYYPMSGTGKRPLTQSSDSYPVLTAPLSFLLLLHPALWPSSLYCKAGASLQCSCFKGLNPPKHC